MLPDGSRQSRLPATRSSFGTAPREKLDPESSSLSHVGQTLVSGVSALPRTTSLDAAGQWPVCGAGTSPTEIPLNVYCRGYRACGRPVANRAALRTAAV